MQELIAYVDVPKKRGSSITTERSALTQAVNTGLLDWRKAIADQPAYLTRGILADALQRYRDIRLSLPINATFDDYLAADAFRGFSVQSHRGYWRVSFSYSPVEA